jgi:DNA-binding NarL/FixJ family response regulator
MKPLTPRQIQVMRGLCAGLVGKEIASEMNRGVRTVQSHIEAAKKSLGARNIAHAAFICGRNGIT